MNPFIISLLSATAAYAFVHLTGIPNFLKEWIAALIGIRIYEVKIKPLDCHACLAFWICLGWIIGVGGAGNVMALIALCLASMVMAHLIYKILNRI